MQTIEICDHSNSKVFDSRENSHGIWRRRRCKDCGHRWTTIEVKVDTQDGRVQAMQALNSSVLSAQLGVTVEQAWAIRALVESFAQKVVP